MPPSRASPSREASSESNETRPSCHPEAPEPYAGSTSLLGTVWRFRLRVVIVTFLPIRHAPGGLATSDSQNACQPSHPSLKWLKLNVVTAVRQVLDSGREESTCVPIRSTLRLSGQRLHSPAQNPEPAIGQVALGWGESPRGRPWPGAHNLLLPGLPPPQLDPPGRERSTARREIAEKQLHRRPQDRATRRTTGNRHPTHLVVDRRRTIGDSRAPTSTTPSPPRAPTSTTPSPLEGRRRKCPPSWGESQPKAQ